mgnify:CR=1 FL=1
MIVICVLKQIYSISDISELISLAIKTARIDYAYNEFCNAIERAILYTFEGIEYKIDNQTFEQYLLQSVAQSFASKLYVEKTFLHK